MKNAKWATVVLVGLLLACGEAKTEKKWTLTESRAYEIAHSVGTYCKAGANGSITTIRATGLGYIEVRYKPPVGVDVAEDTHKPCAAGELLWIGPEDLARIKAEAVNRD